MTNNPVANIIHVDFGYRNRCIFDGLNWHIEPGITALLGPNGAGKTTLLSLLAGLLKPSSGEIVINSPRAGHSTVGLLPQRYELVSSMRVEEAVAHTTWSAGISSNAVAAKTQKALERVNLWEKRGDSIKSLSGGQRQRLAIACTLSPEPSLLLLDEPTVGLDPLQRRSLRELLVDLSASTAIVLSTHLVDDAVATAQNLAVLRSGSFLYTGDLATFVGDSDLETAYVNAVGVES